MNFEQHASDTTLDRSKGNRDHNNTEIEGDSIQDSKPIEANVLDKIGEFKDTVGQQLKEIKALIKTAQERVIALELANPGSTKSPKVEECKKDLKDVHNKLDEMLKDPQDPLVNFSGKSNKANYENSPLGRLEKFAKDILHKWEEPIKDKLKGPIDALKENKFLNALKDFLKSVCNVIIVACDSALKNAVAWGKCAQNLQELVSITASIGKAAIYGKTPNTGVAPTRGR